MSFCVVKWRDINISIEFCVNMAADLVELECQMKSKLSERTVVQDRRIEGMVSAGMNAAIVDVRSMLAVSM